MTGSPPSYKEICNAFRVRDPAHLAAVLLEASWALDTAPDLLGFVYPPEAPDAAAQLPAGEVLRLARRCKVQTQRKANSIIDALLRISGPLYSLSTTACWKPARGTRRYMWATTMSVGPAATAVDFELEVQPCLARVWFGWRAHIAGDLKDCKKCWSVQGTRASSDTPPASSEALAAWASGCVRALEEHLNDCR